MNFNINYHKEFVLIPHRFVCTIPLPQTNDDVIVHQSNQIRIYKTSLAEEIQTPRPITRRQMDKNLRQYSTPMKRPQQNNKTTQQGYDGT